MEDTNILYQVDKVSYQELMEEAQKLAHFGAWEVNILTGAVKWSSEMFQLLGYDPLITEATFKNFVKKLHPKDILYVKNNLQTLLSVPSSDTYDFRILNREDGTVKYLRTGIVVKRTKSGRAISMTGFSQDITEKKLAEKKTENANRELKLFFQVMDDVFFSVDIIARKVVHVSHGAEKLYGYSLARLQADYSLWLEIICKDDYHLIEKGDAKLALGETVVNQYRIIRQDGTVRWVETKVVPTINQNGILVRIDGVTRDITDSKNAEIARRRTEKWYRQIVESAQEGIWTIDENNQTNFVNKMMCEILGYSAEEMMGKDLFYFMDEEGRAYAEECMDRRKKGANENLNIRYTAKSGRHVWANITANPIFDENGVYKGALAMVTDVTENRIAEELLKKSEANLRTVFDNTDIAFVFFNTSYDILSFNSPAADFYREYFDRVLIVGINAFKYFPGDKKSDFEKIIRKVENRELVNYETKFQTKDQGIKWHEVKWVAVINEQNEHMGILLTFKNITERKLLELEREKITADLIQRNKDQEQFNYMISHNLRAPVANIIGLSEIFNDPDMDETDRKEILAGISQSVKSLDEVITDMNDVLQLKDGINEIKETNVFSSLVNDIKLSISNIISKEQVVINCRFEAEGIFSIKSYLYSIFYNLILNSIKYRKSGVSPVIDIRSTLIKNKIELTFTDNGKGIDLHHNGSQLFGLYKRFDNTVEGKGLGLYMVKTQIESLGGTIKVKSEPDKGTQFIIELPV